MVAAVPTLGGSGFGLFISKGIVDLHDGTISVYSAGEGHGSSFILSMPMTHAAASGNGLDVPCCLDTLHQHQHI